MIYTIKDMLDVLDNLTLDSEGGQLKKFFPEPDPRHMEDLYERIMNIVKKEPVYINGQ